MYKKTNLKKRIDLILITVEALDLYTLEDTQRLSTIHTHDLLLFRLDSYLRHSQRNFTLQFKQYIKIMHLFYSIINQADLNNLAIEILNNICSPIQSKITIQYLQKFRYIYNQTQNYYNTYSDSECDKPNIYSIAITNLYIINQINTQYGIYYLIKYLYD